VCFAQSHSLRAQGVSRSQRQECSRKRYLCLMKRMTKVILQYKVVYEKISVWTCNSGPGPTAPRAPNTHWSMSIRKVSLLQSNPHEEEDVLPTAFGRALSCVLDGSLRLALTASGLRVGTRCLLGLGMTAAVFVFDLNTHDGQVCI